VTSTGSPPPSSTVPSEPAGGRSTGAHIRSAIHEGTVVHHRFEPVDHPFVTGEPGPRLVVGVDDLDHDRRIFPASMVLHRRSVGRHALGRVLWRYPLMTMRVSWGIYRQDLALRHKGVPVHPHPGRAGRQEGLRS
jgi:DUF1365 family protein